MANRQSANILKRHGREWPLIVSFITTGLFLAFSNFLLDDLSNAAWFAFILIWLFGVVLLSAFAVVRHAEALAHQVGEPLGTLILTLSVTGIEVMMIAAMMYSSTSGSTLARDSMFAVIMIVLNGMVGISLLLGGLRHHEQTYNLRGANAFLAVIVPMAVLGLVLPNFTVSSPGPSYSRLHAAILTVMSIGLYVVFLAIQNVRHREFFIDSTAEDAAAEAGKPNHNDSDGSIAFHAVFLIVYLLPLVVLSKKLAIPIDHAIRVLNAPPAMGGFLVAVLILSPESLSATRAAMNNQLQRAVNVLLGSVLATISLTIPAVLIIGFITGHTIVLGLSPANIVLLLLTLAVSTMTFASIRTNVLLGAVHILLLVAYVMLIFDR